MLVPKPVTGSHTELNIIDFCPLPQDPLQSCGRYITNQPGYKDLASESSVVTRGYSIPAPRGAAGLSIYR